MTISCLLLEDHAISREFLSQALTELPCDVQAAANMAEAVKLVQKNHFDLWLCDMHLPDGQGTEILGRLRDSVTAGSKHTHAIAITADLAKDVSLELHEAGFAAVLCKPISIAQLHAAVKRVMKDRSMPVISMDSSAHWDETAALAAVGGRESILKALREMFIKELPVQSCSIKQAYSVRDSAVMKSELHKLMAACGFVGAAKLKEKVDALSAAPDDERKLQDFLNCAEHYHAQGL
jgi:CheY-like chemotaxis protein